MKEKIMRYRSLIILIMLGFIFSCNSGEKNHKRKLQIAVEQSYVPYFTQVTEDFLQSHGDVEFEIIVAKMFDILDALPIQKANAPDIFLVSSISKRVDQKLIAPFTFHLIDYSDNAIATASHQGDLYFLPMSMETTFLIYNKDLVTDAPAFLSQLDPSEWAAKYTDFYHAAGMFYGKGGYVFGQDDLDLGLASEGAKEAGKIIQSLYNSGFEHWSLMKDDTIAHDVMMNAFYNEEIAYVINGPWMLADIARNGINVGVAPIPSWDGSHLYQPFSGSKGLSINAYSRHLDLAQEFLEFIAQEKYAQMWYEMTDEVSAHLGVTYPKGSIHETIAIAIQNSVSKPNNLAINVVWIPMADALKQIANGEDVSQALDSAQQIIKREIEDL